MSDTYAYGSLRRIGVGKYAGRYTLRYHALEIDHRYGPANSTAWGRTLCGLTGSILSKDYTWEAVTELFSKLGGYVQPCRTCLAVLTKPRRVST